MTTPEGWLRIRAILAARHLTVAPAPAPAPTPDELATEAQIAAQVRGLEEVVKNGATARLSRHLPVDTGGRG